MKYVFLALLSLSIASDVSVDVYYAQSPNTNTEVVVEAEGEEVRISVDDYSYTDDYGTYSYSGATAYVNSNQGDATTDELTVGYSTYTSETYSDNYAYAYTAEGDYAYADQYTSTSSDGQGNVNTTDGVSAYTYDATTGEYTYDYVTVDTYTDATNPNDTYIYSETTASVDTVYYEEETYTYIDNQTGEGYGYGEFGLWVNAQALSNKTFGDFVYAFLVLIALGAAVILACRKILQETQKMHDVTTVDSSVSYIRI